MVWRMMMMGNWFEICSKEFSLAYKGIKDRLLYGYATIRFIELVF
jgi:hypothetical protein